MNTVLLSQAKAPIITKLMNGGKQPEAETAVNQLRTMEEKVVVDTKSTIKEKVTAQFKQQERVVSSVYAHIQSIFKTNILISRTEAISMVKQDSVLNDKAKNQIITNLQDNSSNKEVPVLASIIEKLNTEEKKALDEAPITA